MMQLVNLFQTEKRASYLNKLGERAPYYQKKKKKRKQSDMTIFEPPTEKCIDFLDHHVTERDTGDS